MNAADTTHEFFEELAVGHALNALEPEDEQVFLAHLATCATCERAVADNVQTLAHLAYGTVSEEPPASLLEGIRAGVAASGRSVELPHPASLDAARARRKGRTVKMTTAMTGVAASIVLVAALLLVNAGLQSKNTELQSNQAAFRATVSSLLVPGAKQMSLSGEAGKAVAVMNGNKVSLVVEGVSANDANSIYVLWEKSQFGDVRAVGTFSVGSAGLTVANDLRLHEGPDSVKQLIVTREKGTKAPPLAAGPVVVASAA